MEVPAQWRALPSPCHVQAPPALRAPAKAAPRNHLSFLGVAVLGASRLTRSKTSLQVRRRPLPVVKEKEVIATKRLPLWQLSDEMYMQRQLAPDPMQSWTEVRRAQARMKEQVMAQQYKDFRRIEREIGGYRLPPTYHISELRAGMWLEGRVSQTHDRGVMVDVGAYTEQGEWTDGFLHMGQIKDDGGYVAQDKVMDFVHIGERVRVRVVECIPTTGILRLSMRTEEEDLPELFLGKPRPYSWHDIEKGMKVTGIIRRVWDKWALVDIGADRLARIHAREHPREKNEYGFYNWDRIHKFAWTAFPRGAQMTFWVEKAKDGLVNLCANKPPSTKLSDKVAANRRTGAGIEPGLERGGERLTRQQLRDREKSEAEKADWTPYIAHVDEWLEEASEPDGITDSWVARTEREIFAEFNEENGTSEEQAEEIELASSMPEEDFDDSDDFAEDEFAEDDFDDDSDFIADDAPFSLANPEDDAWELKDSPDQERSEGLLY
ncbi:unnamed protein product [Effrenium voratum]|uniref:S1 motif domain-containing protein n=1 Tax=Effrenium voratum TaxID=2562239 RepID=A0AA36JCG9_9DINO|nr:unnamed protein product [Effrenium voratum]CAJ1447585.1 unnamed protein product [Effrenium voratum]